jgi:hypothetical protein
MEITPYNHHAKAPSSPGALVLKPRLPGRSSLRSYPINPAPAPVWQKRFYDFNVWTEQKQIEKLRYIHRNPVKRGLVDRRRVEQLSFLSLPRDWIGAGEISGVTNGDQGSSGREVW